MASRIPLGKFAPDGERFLLQVCTITRSTILIILKIAQQIPGRAKSPDLSGFNNSLPRFISVNLSKIKTFNKTISFFVKMKNLCFAFQHDPDVDAIYRLTSPLPLDFNSERQKNAIVCGCSTVVITPEPKNVNSIYRTLQRKTHNHNIFCFVTKARIFVPLKHNRSYFEVI